MSIQLSIVTGGNHCIVCNYGNIVRRVFIGREIPLWSNVLLLLDNGGLSYSEFSKREIETDRQRVCFILGSGYSTL